MINIPLENRKTNKKLASRWRQWSEVCSGNKRWRISGAESAPNPTSCFPLGRRIRGLKNGFDRFIFYVFEVANFARLQSKRAIKRFGKGVRLERPRKRSKIPKRITKKSLKKQQQVFWWSPTQLLICRFKACVWQRTGCPILLILFSVLRCYFVAGQTNVKPPHLNFTKTGSISPDLGDLLVDYPC
jgi:hypothetical protein